MCNIPDLDVSQGCKPFSFPGGSCSASIYPSMPQSIQSIVSLTTAHPSPVVHSQSYSASSAEVLGGAQSLASVLPRGEWNHRTWPGACGSHCGSGGHGVVSSWVQVPETFYVDGGRPEKKCDWLPHWSWMAGAPAWQPVAIIWGTGGGAVGPGGGPRGHS